MVSLTNKLESQELILIDSLKSQPLLVVLRPNQFDLNDFSLESNFYNKIKTLNDHGVKHIEISWMADPDWISLIKILDKDFQDIYLGVSSITSKEGLNSIKDLNVKYSMSPIFDEELQEHAKDINQLLIPGVFSPSEIQKSKNFGCKIIKLFPAYTLGIEYLNQIKTPLQEFPFTICAGGLSAKDINSWLNAGYNAIALGRKLMHKGNLDTDLKAWLKLNPMDKK